MSKSTQPSDNLLSDPIRVVYHAQDRTFARLFNERSLEEVINLVRRKFGVGRETDVTLKQMSPEGLLDLEDDDDFQAWRALLKPSTTMDIQVTVGKSRGSVLPPPPGASQPEVQPLASPSEQPAISATAGTSRVQPKIVAPVTGPTTIGKTLKISTRKRKVSFGDATSVATPDKPSERRSLKKPVSPVASAEATATPTTSKPVDTEEPPKKKQKKTATKAKDVQPAEAAESHATKVSATPKSKPKKSAVLDRGSEAGTSTPKDAETFEPPAKKQAKAKKTETSTPKDAETSKLPAKKQTKPDKIGSTGPEKPSAPVDQDDNHPDRHQSVVLPDNIGTGQPVDLPSGSMNEASLQPASEEPLRISARDGTSKTSRSSKAKKPPRGTACAAIPRTIESTNVQSEVAAAILSGYLSKTSETVPPEPLPKRKYVKKTTKKPSAPSRPLSVESAMVLDAPADKTLNISTEHTIEHVVLTNEAAQQPLEVNGPSCPICLGEPFHIRYYCPTVLKGPDAIRGRLEELKRADRGNHHSLIKELEGLLRDSEATSRPPVNAVPTDVVQSRETSPPLNAPPPRTPTIPSNSYMSEVTVESRDEGSSSESSDGMSVEGMEHKELPGPRRQQTSDEQRSSANDDLEAVIRGPVSKRQSIVHFIDRIVGDEDDEHPGSGEDEARLEEDSDSDINRSRRRLSGNSKRSSDSESGDESEGSTSSSSSRSAKDVSNNPEYVVQCSSKPTEESAQPHDNDVVIMDSINPLVPEGQDADSSEETHVGSEDRMVVDQESAGEKGAALRTSVLSPSNAPSNKTQEPRQMEGEPTSNQDGAVPSEVPNGIEADPIEPADDLESLVILRSPDADPIEAPHEEIESLFTGVAQSTPMPGVTKRIKTRDGQILDDETEHPVLLEQLASEVMDKANPLPAKGKSRRRKTETSANQEPTQTRKSPRFSSVAPSTSTPAAVTLLKPAQFGKAANIPAKRSEERSDAAQSSAKDGVAQNGARIAATPSLIRWEALVEPSSPSLQPDEISVRIDELMSSSPQPDDPVRVRSNNKEKKVQSRRCLPTPSSQAASSRKKERLFDLSSSQIPFPYSQHQNNPAPTAFPNGKEREGTTDSEGEPKVPKKKAKIPVRYRSLSQLAAQMSQFSPNLPTPANKSVNGGKAKKRAADEDSSSSSSSDAEEVNGSEHIPRGRRAGTVLETRRKKKSLLLKI